MHDDPAILRKMMEPVGKAVSFQYPPNEGRKKGVLKDRVIIPSNPGSDGVPYWDVVDLISFSETEPDWIRIGYYRKPKDRLVWGSQTTITEPVGVWKRILAEAARAKPWFHSILEDALAEVRLANRKEIIAEFIRVERKGDTVEFSVGHIHWESPGEPRTQWDLVFSSDMPLGCTVGSTHSVTVGWLGSAVSCRCGASCPRETPSVRRHATTSILPKAAIPSRHELN